MEGCSLHGKRPGAQTAPLGREYAGHMMRRRDLPALLLSPIVTRVLRAAGFQPEALEKITAEIKRGAYPNTHALLVEHDGRLVYEQYFAGTDERWGDSLGRRTFDEN